MKKSIYLFIFLSSLFYSESFAGCDFVIISPSGVSPGDTVIIEIVSDYINCGEFSRAGYIEPLGMDTLYFDEFEIVNDTLAKVLAIFPSNLPYAETEFFICNKHYWDNRIGTTITIGSNTTVYEPDLCMVTVDSRGKNMIIWSAPEFENIDSVLIYKETFSLNNFITIGSVDGDNLFFTDTLSEPSQQSDRYKIMMKDKSGNETLTSDIHKTIHLTINAGIGGRWNLIWNKYEGFSYTSYNILRGTTKGALLKIAEVPVNTFSYTDLYPPIETSFYQIEAINPDPCYVAELKSSMIIYNSTRSNMVVADQADYISVEMDKQVLFWPNPAKDMLFYHLENPVKTADLTILSMGGKVLVRKQLTGNGDAINIDQLKPGIYMIQFSTSDQLFHKKIIKR